MCVRSCCVYVCVHTSVCVRVYAVVTVITRYTRCQPWQWMCACVFERVSVCVCVYVHMCVCSSLCVLVCARVRVNTRYTHCQPWQHPVCARMCMYEHRRVFVWTQALMYASWNMCMPFSLVNYEAKGGVCNLSLTRRFWELGKVWETMSHDHTVTGIIREFSKAKSADYKRARAFLDFCGRSFWQGNHTIKTPAHISCARRYRMCVWVCTCACLNTYAGLCNNWFL